MTSNIFQLRLDSRLQSLAQAKAGLIPLAAVIRTLLILWILGRVDLPAEGEVERLYQDFEQVNFG